MITSFSIIFTSLVMAAQQDAIIVSTGHDVSPEFNQTDYKSACGSQVFRVRFRNGPDEHGRVDQISINGRPVVGAAEQLQIRAARRVISRIGIMNCGADSERPTFRGIMELAKPESQAARLRPTLFFRITREGREGWRLTVD